MLLAFGLSPSPMEIMVIAVIALIVLGPSRLPEAARSLGKGLREMRDSFSGNDDDDDDDDDGDDPMLDADFDDDDEPDEDMEPEDDDDADLEPLNERDSSDEPQATPAASGA